MRSYFRCYHEIIVIQINVSKNYLQKTQVHLGSIETLIKWRPVFTLGPALCGSQFPKDYLRVSEALENCSYATRDISEGDIRLVYATAFPESLTYAKVLFENHRRLGWCRECIRVYINYEGLIFAGLAGKFCG